MRVSLLRAVSTVLFAAACLPAAGFAEAFENETRTWTNREGRQIRARLSHIEGGAAVIFDGSGRRMRVAVEDLSELDQTFLARCREFGYAYPTPAFPHETSPAADVEVAGGPRIYHTTHFSFHSEREISPAFAREAALVFEGTHAALAALPFGFGVRPPADEGRFRTRFLTRESFLAALRDHPVERRASVAGVYLAMRGEVLVPFGEVGAREHGSRLTLRKASDTSTLVHEIAHQLLHEHLPLLPVWLAEGIAEYLAATPYQSGRFRFHEVQRGLEERLAGRYGRGDDEVIRLPHPSVWLSEGGAPWKGDPGDYEAALLYAFYFIHDDRPPAPGAPVAAYLRRLDESRRDATRLIGRYNEAVVRYREDVARYNASLARYREDFALYREAVETYNARARRYNRQVRDGVAPGERIAVGEEPRAPREPGAPVPPAELEDPPFTGPIDLVAAAQRFALPTLVRGRSHEEIARRMEEAWAARGITVRVDPPPVARDEALRTLRTGGEP